MDRLLRPSQAHPGHEDQTENRLTLPAGAIIDVTAAERVADLTLRVQFSDGAKRVLDFEPFLRSSQNPLIRIYLDPVKFADFRVEDGDLIWDDYGLCFSVADLYENRMDPR